MTADVVICHRKGMRPITRAYLIAEDYARRWKGMPKGSCKADLLKVIEDIPAKNLGISKGAKTYLHFLIKRQNHTAFVTEDQVNPLKAHELGLMLISTYRDTNVADLLNTVPRTLARWRAELATAKWISFRDRGDRNFWNGQGKDRYGVDLRPVVVRFRELKNLAELTKDVRYAVSEKRHRAGAIKARLSQLSVVYPNRLPSNYESVVKNLVRVLRNKPSLEFDKWLRQGEALVSRMERLILSQDDELNHLTFVSGQPDNYGAPDNSSPALDSIKREEADSIPDKLDTDWPDEADSEINDAEKLDWAELDEDEDSAIKADPGFESMPAIQLPSPTQLLDHLDVIYAKHGLQYSRPAGYEDDSHFIITLGLAMAGQHLRMPARELDRWRDFPALDPMNIAVAALVARFKSGVRYNRLTYYRALLKSLTNEWGYNDLAAAWRQIQKDHGIRGFDE